MKTTYTTEIENLLKNTFSPATPTTKNAQPHTLQELYELITSVLPAKWVYEEDVYNALQTQGFKTYLHKKESTDKELLYYFVSLNQ